MSTEMEVPSMEADLNVPIDQTPLLTASTGSNDEHVINITTVDHASSTSSIRVQPSVLNRSQQEDTLPRGMGSPTGLFSSIQRNRIFPSRIGPRPIHSFDVATEMSSATCLQIESSIISGQIILSVLILFLVRGNDLPPSLFAWLACFACAYVATLPTLLWRRWNCDGDSEQFPLPHQDATESNPLMPISYTAVASTQPSNEINQLNTRTGSMRQRGNSSILFNKLMNHFKGIMDFIFACWFFIGYKMSFYEPAPSEAAAEFRMWTVILGFSCIMSAIPTAFYAMIYFCIFLLARGMNITDDNIQSRGATMETINSLTKYKFKMMMCEDGNQCVLRTYEGGILALGRGKECSISEEDAVCSVCLTRYVDDDIVKKLPCLHMFHAECLDKWLAINATCPLCQTEVGKSSRVYCCGIFRLFC